MSSNGRQGQRADALPLALPSAPIPGPESRVVALERRLREMPPGSLVPVAWVLAEIEALEATGGIITESARPLPSPPDRLLTPQEVAERLGTTAQWVYTNWRKRLPFGRKLSHRCLRFSTRGLERHLAGARGAA